ncbi:hypothetical protein [Aestuariibacter salexigens]|uniref:hypothetical protein n=1 Tax=Aestuariibacter salexigens TaxID=226010 RepID=UPI000413AF7A|nr:hypothetical protein [Aestuariibacter salexigens]
MSLETFATRHKITLNEEQKMALAHPAICRATELLIEVDDMMYLYNPLDNYNLANFEREFSNVLANAAYVLAKQDSSVKNDMVEICLGLNTLAEMFSSQTNGFPNSQSYLEKRQYILTGFWVRFCKSHGEQRALALGKKDQLSIWEETLGVFWDYCTDERNPDFMPAAKHINHHLNEERAKINLFSADWDFPKQNLTLWRSKADELDVAPLQRKGILFTTAFCGHFKRDSAIRTSMLEWLKPTSITDMLKSRFSDLDIRNISRLIQDLTLVLGERRIERSISYRGTPLSPLDFVSHGLLTPREEDAHLTMFDVHGVYTEFTEKLGFLLDNIRLTDEEAFVAGIYFCKIEVPNDPMGYEWCSRTVSLLAPPVFRFFLNMPAYQKKEELPEFLPIQAVLSEFIRGKIPSDIIGVTWSVQSYLFYKSEKGNAGQVQFMAPKIFADKVLDCIEQYRQQYRLELEKLPVKDMLPANDRRPGLMKNIWRKLKRILSQQWGCDENAISSNNIQIRLMTNVCILYALLALRANSQPL